MSLMSFCFFESLSFDSSSFFQTDACVFLSVDLDNMDQIIYLKLQNDIFFVNLDVESGRLFAEYC